MNRPKRDVPVRRIPFEQFLREKISGYEAPGDDSDIERVLNCPYDLFFDADGKVVPKDDPRAETARFASTGHFEELG
jgi:hypothetical protein